MWRTEQHLSHDLPCTACGHAPHRYLPCSDSCDCVPPEVPGGPSGMAATSELVGAL